MILVTWFVVNSRKNIVEVSSRAFSGVQLCHERHSVFRRGTSGLNHARASHTISNLILQAMYARSLHKFEHLLSPPRPSPQTVGKCGPKLGGQCSCLTAVFGLRFVDGISICLRNTHREGTDICTTEEIDSLTGSACVCGIMHREETDVICVSPWIG